MPEPRLIPSMSDPEILRELGMDPEAASAEFTQGKDGTSTVYLHGHQQVVITRSKVTGTSVLATGPLTGHWKL